jgi:DNA-binding transcriptional ArsR family regulator
MINKDILNEHKNHRISEKELYETYKLFFGTLVSEPRLRIINLLREKERTVSEIMNDLEMDQTAVSHNLARLKKCGFVVSEVDGKFRWYNLNKETIGPMINIINKHMESHCVHILRKMKGGKRK